jgi:uncharacterized protein YbaR (Trm112 family)
MDLAGATNGNGGGVSAGFDERILEQLACPVCRGGLLIAGAGLKCSGCGRVYPVVDGIPVLIGEQAAGAPSV